jgi:asparagine synthase (glutamine-hydrolysing)
MCGIAGFVNVKETAGREPEHLERMLQAIAHRGPDEYGYYYGGTIGLAAARLSIIDLAHGQQPMIDEGGRYVLVFNGEIFNYLELRSELEQCGVRFRTDSDTEVLLRCLIHFDEGAFTRINGQFAFALLDRARGRLLIARDRFGERPLFLLLHDNALVFGSEIKAIFALPFVRRSLDVPALQRLAHMWTGLPGDTCFSGIKSLRPGYFGIFDNGTLTERQYYHLPEARPSTDLSRSNAAANIRTALEASVRLRLRSDVSVGTYLSGGLDSTIVTALAQRVSGTQLQTFSVGFDDADYDETSHQKLVARHLGTRHDSILIKRRDIAEVMRDVVWHAETALFRSAPAPMYILARHVRQSGYKLVLTGEGSDEAFFGYDIFKESLFRQNFDLFAGDTERTKQLATLYPYLAHFHGPHARALLLYFRQHTKERTPGLFSHEMRLSNGIFAAQLFSRAFNGAQSAADLAKRVNSAEPDFAARPLLDRAQMLEYLTLLAGYLLSSQGDRMSAAHGVETRSPFLDPEVVRLARLLPNDYCLADGQQEKAILKSAFSDLVPRDVLERSKHPYRAPDAGSFIATDAPDWIQDITAATYVAQTGLFRTEEVTRLMTKLRRPALTPSPREDHAFMVVLTTLLLNRLFIEDFSIHNVDLSKRLVRRLASSLFS